MCFLGFVFKAFNFLIARTEIPRNTHVSKKVCHRGARFAMSWQDFKPTGFLVLGALDSSLQNWGALLKNVWGAQVPWPCSSGKNKLEAPR